MKKLIHYKLPVSRTYPAYHLRSGEKTNFVEKISNNSNIWIGSESVRLLSVAEFGYKIHTIRNNFELWEKRMKKVQEGKAVIDLFYWVLPGGRFTKNNAKFVFATLDKDSGCGLQKIDFVDTYDTERICAPFVNTRILDLTQLAANDGLSFDNFLYWFRKYDLTKPMAIIHFTEFRY